MNLRTHSAWILALGAAVLTPQISAQQITDTRTPDRRGGGGDGKCTIEVEVDDVAEVEIFGNRAQIRTLSGSPARFRRFECNQDIPNNPNDFRFEGVDGRGRQQLVRSPGRGPAVIRIEDSKGGREGYTFDIFWRGGGGFGGGRGDYGGGRGDYGGGRGNYGNNGNYGNGNWNRDLDFRGRGQGFFREFRGPDTQLSNCRVNIDRSGRIEVTFDTGGAFALLLNGRVQRLDRDRIYADMRGNNLSGIMEIETDGRNRVRSINMRSDQRGRNRFELSWRD